MVDDLVLYQGPLVRPCLVSRPFRKTRVVALLLGQAYKMYFSQKYWSSQNRTNWTGCAGPVDILELVHLSSITFAKHYL